MSDEIIANPAAALEATTFEGDVTETEPTDEFYGNDNNRRVAERMKAERAEAEQVASSVETVKPQKPLYELQREVNQDLSPNKSIRAAVLDTAKKAKK